MTQERFPLVGGRCPVFELGWRFRRADRPLPAPIVDHDPGDETWTIRVSSGYTAWAGFEHWTCRVCFMSNGPREQLVKRTGGRRCGFCNAERCASTARTA